MSPVSGMNDAYGWGIWKTFNVMVMTALGSGAFAVGIAQITPATRRTLGLSLLDAFDLVARREGILPALESSHAIAWAVKEAARRPISVRERSLGEGTTLPLGVLSLLDRSNGSLKKAQKIIRKERELILKLKVNL